MNELIIEGVRCFRDEQRIPIRPVTLLVGENSAGKSTVLAMVRAAWDIAFGSTEPDFNELPFDLGGFDAIAHYRGGQAKRVQEFQIGGVFSIEGDNEGSTRSVHATFRERTGQPMMSTWRATQGDLSLNVNAWNRERIRVVARRKNTVLLDERVSERRSKAHPATDAFLSLSLRTLKARQSPAAWSSREFFNLLPGGSGDNRPRPAASAPIRSKPERTYDPRRGLPEPEGSHVPMELAALSVTAPAQFRALVRNIAEYGTEANLFAKLDVKRLGKKSGDPFQLMVAADKFAFNLRDVGYGVSQILPILVDTLRAPKRQTFLLQQPEVHLHPRAQAALGSLIVRQAAKRKQTFLVETHSDHLADRIRMDVRKRDGGTLSARDVIILYFERRAGRATVHPIEIDDDGNLVDVPAGYRRFFLDEERKLLGL